MATKETMDKEITQVPEKKQIHTKEETSISEPLASVADSNKPLKQDFPVVGIGASAGGLNAFEAFFSGLPAKVNPGVAFVIIQHLDPKHKSILSALVGRYTDLPVYEINDGMEVKPNCVYIIPPDSDLSYGEDILHLEKPIEPHGHRMPIDFFFRSLG